MNKKRSENGGTYSAVTETNSGLRISAALGVKGITQRKPPSRCLSRAEDPYGAGLLRLTVTDVGG